jgi:hypothetical protein
VARQSEADEADVEAADAEKEAGLLVEALAAAEGARPEERRTAAAVAAWRAGEAATAAVAAEAAYASLGQFSLLAEFCSCPFSAGARLAFINSRELFGIALGANQGGRVESNLDQDQWMEACPGLIALCIIVESRAVL